MESFESRFNEELASEISQSLATTLVMKTAGHMARMVDLPTKYIEKVCRLLAARMPEIETYILSDETQALPFITATKLIERRNLSKKILLVFIPPGLKTAAEDSYGENTFESLSVQPSLREIKKAWVSELSSTFTYLQKILESRHFREKRVPTEKILQYLYAIKNNITDPLAPGKFLYIVGLIPDYRLSGSGIEASIDRNSKVVSILSNPEIALMTKIEDLTKKDPWLKPESIQLELFSRLRENEGLDPDRWLINTIEWQLTFDTWSFKEKENQNSEQMDVKVELSSLDKFKGLEWEIKGEYWQANTREPVTVVWKIIPASPPLFSHFLLYVLHYDRQEELLPPKKVNRIKRSLKVNFKDIALDEDSRALVYIECRAVTADGETIASGQSEPFWIMGENEPNDEGESETEIIEDPNGDEVRSVVEAILISTLRFKSEKRKFTVEVNRDRSGWVGSKVKDGEYDIYRLRMSTGDTFHLKIGKLLRIIEAEILERPCDLRHFSVRSEKNITVDGQIEAVVLSAKVEELANFLRARKTLFDAIKSKTPLIDLIDLNEFSEYIENYAHSYVKILSMPEIFSSVSNLDTVEFNLDGNNTAILLAPTHPMKLLWLLQYQKLITSWTGDVLGGKAEKAKLFDRSSLDLISPLNQPAFLLVPKVGVVSNVDSIGLFWGIFLPINSGNKDSLSPLYRRLGLPSTKVSLSSIRADQIGDRINQYISQHHYVKTLSVNVINPGDGSLILNALRFLQSNLGQRELNYDIRFFCDNNSDLEQIGSVFEQLVSETEEGRGQDIDEAFLSSTNNPLLPRMAFSRHFVSDWNNKGEFDAHITIILDYFNSTLTTTVLNHIGESSGLDGLLLEFLSDYISESDISWIRSIQPGNHSTNSSAGSTTELLIELQVKWLQTISMAIPGNNPGDVPAITLKLTSEDKNILERVHKYSNWVITIDRNFGVEYYDTPLLSRENYLIDYTPDLLGEFGQRIVVSTASTNEIEAIISKILKDKKLLTENSRPVDVLAALKALSGRSAIQVLSHADTSDSLVIFGLIYRSLIEQGVLKDAVLLPASNHVIFFGSNAKNALAIVRNKGDEIEIELIAFRFVPGDFIGEEYQVREEIRLELDATRTALFDVYLNTSAPDYDIRIKSFCNTLNYYLERSVRYGFIEKKSESYETFRRTLGGLCYRSAKLKSSMTGLIVKSSGVTQQIEDYHGIKMQVVGPSSIIADISTMKLAHPISDEEIDSNDFVAEPYLPISSVLPEQTGDNKKGENLENVPDNGISKSNEIEVLLGKRSDNAHPIIWSPSKLTPKRLTNQHILIVGKSGSGKTQTIYALVYELWKNGIPSLLLDFHGEYCDSNSAQFRKAVNATILDAAHGIPINPLTVPLDPLTEKPTDYRNVIYQVTESLSDIFGLGDIQKRILKKAIETSYTNSQFTRDPLTWKNKAPEFMDVWQELLKIEEQERGRAQNLVARVEPLYESEVFKGGEQTFEKIMSQVTIVRLSSLANKELRIAISRFFLQKVYEHMLSMGPAEKQRLFCVLDEAHKLSHDPTITDLIKEARKYGVGLVLSSQETKDFDKSIFANTGTLIALQLEIEDAKVMAENLGLLHPMERQAAIEILLRQQPGQALLRNNHYQPYVQVQITPFSSRL